VLDIGIDEEGAIFLRLAWPLEIASDLAVFAEAHIIGFQFHDTLHIQCKFIMPRIPSEADIIFNKANVALAKSQRLLASWLPPRKPEELQNTKTEEELEREEREMFVPMPETYVWPAMLSSSCV